jgi:membrane protease YdiL (CAAX protease family)
MAEADAGELAGASNAGLTRAEGRGRWTEVAVYLGLTVVLTNLLGIPMLAGLIPADLLNVVVPVLQYTPFVVALIMFRVLRPGRFRDVFAVRRAGVLRWGLIGVGIIAAVAAAELIFGLATRASRLAPVDQIVGLLPVLVIVLAMQSVFAIGEEFGWRGWLVDRAAHWGFWRLSLIFIPVWMLWHLPVLGTLTDETVGEKLIYFLGMGAWAPLLFALRLRSGSVWPAVLAHGAINSVRVYLLQSVPLNPVDQLAGQILGWVLLIAAAAWLMRPSVRGSIP